MSKVITLSLVALLFVGSTASAVVVDEQIPWWRGQWSTTSQVWEFMTADPGDPTGDGLVPDGPAPGGEPPLASTMLWVTPMVGLDWMSTDPYGSDREGIWPLSGIIEVVVDNHEPPNEKKIVWLQVTWRESTPEGHFDQPVITAIHQPLHLTTAPELVGGAHEDLGAGWYESTYTWEIYPNPVDERFLIQGNIDVDEIIVDTWCIPEPATLGLLLLGGLTLLRRRMK